MERGKPFDVQEMLSDLDGGTLNQQLALAIHESAKSAVRHGGKRKAKVTLELTFDQIAKASQVMIKHKLSFKTLSAKGDVLTTRENDSPMYVTRTGVTSSPEGQTDFVHNQAQAEEEQNV